MRRSILVAWVLALGGPLLVAAPARAAEPAEPAFSITKAKSLFGGAIELTSAASCTGGGYGEFTTALSQAQGAYGTGSTTVACDGAQHTVYTLVLPAQPGAALSLAATATKTVFQPSPFPEAPWTALQVVQPERGTVTPQADVPGAPAVRLDQAVTRPGRTLVDVTVTVTCTAGHHARLALVLTELGFHNRVVYGTTTDQNLTCTGQPQQRTATLVLSATRANSYEGLISMRVQDDDVDSPAGNTDRWAEDDLFT